MTQVRNRTGQCCHPDCFKSVPESKLLCPRHEAASQDDAEALIEAERKFYGKSWPKSQAEEADA